MEWLKSLNGTHINDSNILHFGISLFLGPIYFCLPWWHWLDVSSHWMYYIVRKRFLTAEKQQPNDVVKKKTTTTNCVKCVRSSMRHAGKQRGHQIPELNTNGDTLIYCFSHHFDFHYIHFNCNFLPSFLSITEKKTKINCFQSGEDNWFD